MKSRCLATLLVLLSIPSFSPGQVLAHPEPTLYFIYPAGGQVGKTVDVEMEPGLAMDGAQGLLIEGPPGVTASDVKVTSNVLHAKLTIAADAAPGPRLVRVRGGKNGITNFRYFFVGRLPEILEKEPNNTPATAQEVTLPAVINGRVNPGLDEDCYRFRARAGQRLVAAVLAHGMDITTRGRNNFGFLDTNLELLDAQGKVLAAAEDTLGLDPLIEHTIKTDGLYTVRVRAQGIRGGTSAVYRLTLGDVPYPTHLFPPGGKRGTDVDVEFGGPNVAAARQKVHVIEDSLLPLQHVVLDTPTTDGRALPFLRGDFPEVTEKEPNDTREQAQLLDRPITVNGRFDRSGDEDWYRFPLKKGEAILLHTAAQRMLHSPVDTLLELFDAAGRKIAENDDGTLFASQCSHDIASSDSWLPFTATVDGEYFLRVTDQLGAAGPHAVYRLTLEPLKPDFQLHVWPDAVPVWGPGSTSAFVVHLQQWGDLKSDVRLRLEGLEKGWTGSIGIVSGSTYYPPPHGMQVLMTITAPPDAAVGSVTPLRVVGRTEHDGQVIERVARPLTLYGSGPNDRVHLRDSPSAWAGVAPPLDCARLESSATELTVAVGETVNIPVKVHRTPGSKSEVGLTVDSQTVAVRTALQPPRTLKADENELALPLKIDKELRPGLYGIVVSRAWSADLRVGRPGPCTPLILLRVLPAKK